MQKTDSVTYVAYIIKKESSEPEIVLLSNGRELEGDLFQDYYANTTNRRSETAVLTGNSYEHFWKEIQTRIGAKKKVFIALDGVFNKINLNTLYNPDEKKYLLETLEINYVTSTIDFIKNPRNSESNLITWKDAVLFGNPNFNQTLSTKETNELSFQTSLDIPSFWMDSLTRGMVVKDLPQTKIEIENIAKILGKSKINVVSFLENEATEENIKQVTSPSILHIATHGYFFEDDLHSEFEEEKYFGLERKQFNMNPMLRSGILLAGANETIKNNAKSTGENGILTSLEAGYLNLEQTELVVLSACETGLGKIQNGVGVYGLRKSMKDAGAKNVIMSLWKVDDKVTQEFMTSFYTKLTSGQTIKQAFKETQLEMKEKNPQPFFWGAFILSEN
jgi:CHAT domain-containing protein